MLDELLGSSQIAETLTLGGTLTIMAVSLALGLFISLIYIFTHRKEGYSGSFAVSLIMLPAIIAMIILLIGNNVARAFSLAGAFSLIRFRSALGDSKDMAYVFFTVGVGLACGMGYLTYAALFALILCVVMLLLTLLRYGSRETGKMQLKILLPEDMDYHGAFDEVLNTFTSDHQLLRIKTADFGSLFELTYTLCMRDESESKAFIDKLRSKNGNLNVILMTRDYNQSALT